MGKVWLRQPRRQSLFNEKFIILYCHETDALCEIQGLENQMFQLKSFVAQSVEKRGGKRKTENMTVFSAISLMEKILLESLRRRVRKFWWDYKHVLNSH
jgi:hypothetical protein